MPTDNQRRPTQKMGRVRRDPRADSVPPAVIEERLAEGRVTTSGRPAPKVSAPVPSRGQSMGPPTVAALEAKLAKERAERAAEATEIGELLARATRAEARVKQLEELIAKLLDERAKLEVEVSGQRHSMAAQNLDRRASLEKLARGGALSKLPGGSLDGVRAIATELLRELQAIEDADGVKTPRQTNPPESRKRTPHSGTLPPRAKSSLPETMPPRSRQDPPSSRRSDNPPRSRS